MPEISRFYGIVITINFDDHQPPQFHARYGEHRASIGFDGTVLADRLPLRALVADWELARALQPLVPIAPLD